jgi:pimeloyl-ACP methyl ester carboxylesterase
MRAGWPLPTVILMEATTESRRGSLRRDGHADDSRHRILADSSLTERRLKVAGLSTTVLEGGTGAPLVLLHGGIECGGAYWARVVPRLAKRHRVVVPDVPGLGESEPAARLDAPAFAEWFTALLTVTCDERPALVAHSLLGTFAARYAAHEGELLRRLVIYGAPGIGRYRLPVGLAVAAIRFDLRPSERNQERFERWAFLDSGVTKQQDPAWFNAFDAYTVSRGRVRHVKRTMRQLIRVGTTQVPDAELRRIAIPTALLWGRHDRMVRLGLAEDASARLGWPLHVVDDVGHVPHLERPDSFLRTFDAALES